MWKDKEYLELLEGEGVDTCCFMGSGYELDEVRVGDEFYFSYAYYGALARQDNPDSFKAVIARGPHRSDNFSDRFKLVRKYRFCENKIWGGKIRKDEIVVKNMRTGEDTLIRNDLFFPYRCMFAEPS